jgi:hypothetical protein
MSATVRMFSHSGVSMAFVQNYNTQQSYNGLTQLKQPYLARQSLTVDTGTAQSSDASTLAPAHSKLLFVQVQPGKTVHYEINPDGRAGGARTADTSSPTLTGDEQFDWGSGWTISLLEASA